jgi:hypothetical protein
VVAGIGWHWARVPTTGVLEEFTCGNPFRVSPKNEIVKTWMCTRVL